MVTLNLQMCRYTFDYAVNGLLKNEDNDGSPGSALFFAKADMGC